MKLTRSTDPDEEESSGLVERVKQRSPERTDDESEGLVDRMKEKSVGRTEDEPRGWFDRARAKYGLGALLVAAGVVMVLIPEPTTSTVGMVMVGVGAVLWLASWIR